MERVTIVGSGNIGLCLLGEISRNKRYQVTILTSTPEEFGQFIQVEDVERGVVFKSGDYIATSDIPSAVSDADWVLCTYPASIRKAFLENAAPFIKPGCRVGFFPGYGGAELSCQELLLSGVTVFALQKVPYVARTRARGKVAGLLSRKSRLLVASLPHEDVQSVAEALEDMLLINCGCLPNYLSATLLPGNPLLHTAGSYVMLRDYSPGQVFAEQIYYYRSWNDECSRVICEFSDELMAICEALPIDLSGVQSIQGYYESPTPEDLTKKFHTIPSYWDLLLPMNKVDGGYVPDFSSRFFTEDFPFGVCIIKALGQIAGVSTPTVDDLLLWYERVVGKRYFNPDGSPGPDVGETAIPQLYGISDEDALKEFYLR